MRGKQKVKILGMSVGVFISAVVLIFVLGFIGVGYKMVFKPLSENVERNVFEETQSYVHGKIQDLAKYKKEYDAEETDELMKRSIETVINQQFAQFNKDHVKDPDLRSFLIRMNFTPFFLIGENSASCADGSRYFTL